MKKNVRRAVALVVLPTVILMLAGCGAHRPVIDPKTSAHPERYETDLSECQQLAEQAPSAGSGAAGGAAIGAVIGAGVAVASGHKASAGQAAGGAAVLGGAKGAGSGAQERRHMVSNCMKGRGYAVLN
jgi:outer membrane lipoprotein SlyB